ncbi:MAG TPA: BlaI/MecI/CopY family transcriptional regulator [Phycisphaerae bacterium]|nr:BlaI/MecI/CopY family transcriptional regulator [Phycisphaerae bacterium]
MGETLPHITSAELKILKILWSDGPQTVRQVRDALASEGGEPPAYTTVMTLMKQMAEKGTLRVDRQAPSYVYTAAVHRERVLRQRLTQFLHTVFDGQAADLVLHLVEAAELKPEDLRRIESKIEQQERVERRKPASPRQQRR